MTLISVTIKSSGDKKHSVQVDTDSTIEDLKVIISGEADVPVENQRLIYSGKVLKDTESVASYKIQDGHSIHLVKSSGAKAAAKPATSASGSGQTAQSSASASSASPAVPSNIAAGQGSFNPLADLTGARYAGYAQLPNASMFGPDGGMGAFPDPEQLESAMSSPMFREQMNAMLSDPQMLDMLINQSPQLRNMSPEARQMLQPMFREMLSNPESLRSMMNLSRNFSDRGADAGGAFPAPGSNPTVDSNAPATTGSGAASGSGAAPNFADMFRGMPSLDAFSGAGAGAPADNRPPEEKYENQLRQLNEMGFSDFDSNVAALRRSGGNVQGAIDHLLSSAF